MTYPTTELAARPQAERRREGLRAGKLKVVRTLALAAAGLVTAALVAPAGALAGMTYSFVNITNNNVTDAANGEAQLFVDVNDLGGSEVLFTFRNTGPEAMSITDVYFDDGALLDIARLIDADENGGDAGVDFSEGASPGDLPGGNAVNFNTTAGFLADSDPPAQPNGVNPGESLGVVFTLQGGQGYTDVINALALAQTDPTNDLVGGLRIGIHVQGFDGGGSESFVNNGHTMIPLPATLLLLGCGLIGLGAVTRRRT